MIRVVFFILLFNLFLNATTKVVALSPAINEIIFALNKGDTIVANTTFSNYPLKAQTKQKVGGYFSIELEKIVALKPDMVMLQADNIKTINNLKRLKIPYIALKFNSLEDIQTSIKTIANYYNAKEDANKILNSLSNSLNSIKNIVNNQKILIVVGATKNLNKPIYIIGNNSYLNDIIKSSNNLNAYSSKNNIQPILNIENIIKLNPNIIILLAPYLKDTNSNKNELINAWKSINTNASKNDNIYIINKEYAGIPSQRVINLLEELRKILENVRNK